MAKIARKTAKVFGLTAGVDQIAQFGSLEAASPVFSTDPAVIQGLSNWSAGWFNAVEDVNSPAIEDMNAVCYVDSYQIAYGLQAGVAEWDSGTTYYIGSIAQDGTGLLYVSQTNSNLNHALTDPTNWSPISIGGNAATATLAAAATKLATSQNINGVAFDGTASIIVTAAAGTLTGSTLASNVSTSSLTSVGTLVNLTVTNPISGSVSGAAGSVDASAITGTTLAAGVVTSSLTSVGTLGSLTVTGTVTAGSFIPSSSSVPSNGMYLRAANSIGFATNSVLRGSISSAGAFTIGTAAGTQSHTINGNLLITQATTTSQTFELQNTGTGAGANAGMQHVSGISSLYAYSAYAPANGTLWWFGGALGSAAHYSVSYGGSSGDPTGGQIMFDVANTGSLTLGQASTTVQHSLNTSLGTNATGAGTVLNLPAGKSGNPTGYVQITINGSTAFVPFW